VGSSDVVVDRLRDTDDRDSLVDEPRRRAQRAVAADHHEGVEALTVERRRDRRATLAVDVRVAARGAEHRAAALEQPPDRVPVELAGPGFHQAVPAAEYPDHLGLVAALRARHEPTQRRVEAGAVAAPRENP